MHINVKADVLSGLKVGDRFTVEGITEDIAFPRTHLRRKWWQFWRPTPSKTKLAQFRVVEVLNDPHASDCATHNEPAMPAGDCDCGG